MFILAAVAALAMTALVASSAAASIVPAKFSSSGMKVTTTGITVKRNGLEPKTCTPSSPIGGETTGGEYWVWNEFGLSRFKCSLGELQLVFNGAATFDTVAGTYSLSITGMGSSTSLWSPWGQYWQEAVAKGTWVNGSGATPSKVTFVNQTIGYDGAFKPISIEGTFNATTLSGGLLTLSH